MSKPMHRWCLSACVMLAGLGCSQLDERGAVQGRVCAGVCARDNAIQGATITLALAEDPSLAARPQARTDAEGWFAFTNAAQQGRYLIKVEAEGHRCPTLEARQGQRLEVACEADLDTLLSGPEANLCGRALPGADLSGRALPGLNAIGADLTGADLSDVDLSGAALSGANLTDATLTGASLQAATLSGRALGCDLSPQGDPTRLTGATLREANLSEADVSGVDMTGADLSDAVMTGANLDGAVMAQANLQGLSAHRLGACPEVLPSGWRCIDTAASGRVLIGPRANLAGTDLAGVDLDGLDLSGATMDRAALAGVRALRLIGCPASLPTGWRCVEQPPLGRFALAGPGADLSGANLVGADLSDLDLNGADLSESDVSEANLSAARLQGATLSLLRALALTACPSTLPDGWVCVAQQEGGFVLLGPSVAASGVWLQGVSLVSADLTDADLTGARLDDVNMTGVPMHRARLSDASLARVDASQSAWVDVQADIAILVHVDLSGSDLSGTDLLAKSFLAGLRGVDVTACPDALPQNWRCTPQGSRAGSVLVGPQCDLTDADLAGINLADHIMSGCALDRSDLTGATLARAQLSSASLEDAALGGADLTDADLTEANLTGADLTDADLTGARLDDAVLERLRAARVSACPATLPFRWSCITPPDDTRALVGPWADLSGVVWPGVDLSYMWLDHATLEGAELTGASLFRAKLRGADVSGADLSGADLRGAHVDATDLSNATLGRAQTSAMSALRCPSAGLLPARWSCVRQRATLHMALVGPGVVLAGADLSGVDLSEGRHDLTSADLTGADLSGADLTGVAMSNANLTGARLERARTAVAPNCPAVLPEGWRCDAGVGALIGPAADLREADLEGLDASDATLTDLSAHDLARCPAALPEGWGCVDTTDAGAVVVGPQADLTDAHLSGADLSGVSLREATLEGVVALGIVACPTELPDPWSCVALPEPGGFALVGPGAELVGADLSGVELAAATLEGAHTFPLLGCPASTPAGWRCVDAGSSRWALIGPGADLAFGGDPYEPSEGADLSGVDLSDADLTGTHAPDLAACPSALPPGWGCLLRSFPTGFVLVGPYADVSGVLFYGDEGPANFNGLDLTGTVFTGAQLSYGVMWDEADLSASVLAGASAVDTMTCPAALPEAWSCVAGIMEGGTLIGPYADLRGALSLTAIDLRDMVLTGVRMGRELLVSDLTGADLTDADMVELPTEQLRAHALRGCPARVPFSGDAFYDDGEPNDTCFHARRWECVAQSDGRFVLVGDGADLAGVDLSGVNLDGVSLAGADLTDADLTGASMRGVRLDCIAWGNTVCPDGTNSDTHPGGTCVGHTL